MADNPVTALSYNYWVKTMKTLKAHPSSNDATRQLAEMCLRLMEINKFDRTTIEYLNAEGARAMGDA
jgi:hypothetical protein